MDEVRDVFGGPKSCQLTESLFKMCRKKYFYKCNDTYKTSEVGSGNADSRFKSFIDICTIGTVYTYYIHVKNDQIQAECKILNSGIKL